MMFKKHCGTWIVCGTVHVPATFCHCSSSVVQPLPLKSEFYTKDYYRVLLNQTVHEVGSETPRESQKNLPVQCQNALSLISSSSDFMEHTTSHSDSISLCKTSLSREVDVHCSSVSVFMLSMPLHVWMQVWGHRNYAPFCSLQMLHECTWHFDGNAVRWIQIILFAPLITFFFPNLRLDVNHFLSFYCKKNK